MINIDLVRIGIFVFYSHLKSIQNMYTRKSILNFNNIILRIYKLGQWNLINSNRYLVVHRVIFFSRMYQISLMMLQRHLYLNTFLHRNLIFIELLSIDWLNHHYVFYRYGIWNDLYDQVTKVYYTYNKNFCHINKP